MSTSSCSCNSAETPAPSRRREWIFLASVSVWFALGLVLTFNAILPGWGVWLWFIPGYLVVGWDVLKTAGRKILEGRAFDETFLMSIATIGAIVIGELPEAMAVMLFYRIGEAVQDLAVDRSRDSIRSLVAVRPDAAHLQTPDGWQTVSPETVNVGELILVKPGERIPLDGEVVSGNSELDTSALTGESVPRRVREGDAALSGCINQSGALTLRVTRPFAESSVSRILELVENARHQKAPTEKFMTRFARRYTPVVVGLALAIALIPPLVLADASLTEWGYRALVLLVISCPCGLVVSIPLGYFGGVGGAAKQGILVKGSVFLDRLTQVATVVFDKTGTLTEGTFEVTEVRPQGNWDAETLLRYAAIAESQSTHPIAKSISRAADLDGEPQVSEVKEVAGCGIRATLSDASISAVSVGNERLFGDRDFPPYSGAGTIVRVAFDGDYAGDIVVSDRLREDARDAVNGLRAVGVERLVMLTGDRRSVGDAVGQLLGLDEVQAELLPEDKSQALEALLRDPRRRGSVAFVGDGINDAPAIALADVGIAMGGLGSDAAIETADVVLMADTPSKLPVAVAVARKTRAIVWQNITFALGVKLLVIALGAVGLANLWEAVFADVGVALVAVANATRAFKGGGLPQPAVADSPEPQKTTLSSDVPT